MEPDEVSFERRQIRLLAMALGQVIAALVVSGAMPEEGAEALIASVDTETKPATELIDYLRQGFDHLLAVSRKPDLGAGEPTPSP